MAAAFFEEEVLPPMDPIEAEVDAIRRQIWEETKDMTREERWAYLDAQSAPLLKKFNIKFVNLKPVPPHKRPPDSVLMQDD